MERRELLMAMVALSTGGLPILAGEKIKKGDCTYKGFKLFGKVQIVEHFPDLKIQWVDHFPGVP